MRFCNSEVEDQKFKVILCYLASLKLAWATGDLALSSPQSVCVRKTKIRGKTNDCFVFIVLSFLPATFCLNIGGAADC